MGDKFQNRGHSLLPAFDCFSSCAENSSVEIILGSVFKKFSPSLGESKRQSSSPDCVSAVYCREVDSLAEAADQSSDSYSTIRC